MQKVMTLKEKWNHLVVELTNQFSDGEDLNVDGIIYLIGVQELGQGKRRFKKDEKVNLMHIAICKLLEPYGYYEFDYFDADGWPHYKMLTELPNLKAGEQTVLMKTFRSDWDEFKKNPEGAKDLIKIGEEEASEDYDATELASWTMLASLIMNMDEFVTKN